MYIKHMKQIQHINLLPQVRTYNTEAKGYWFSSQDKLINNQDFIM
jgi:hypothetical protein